MIARKVRSFKTMIALALTAMLMLGVMGTALASATPSDNDTNRDNEWAHVNVLDTRIGEIDLEFVSTRAFWSCFEYRTDGDTSQVLDQNNGENYNALITDGLYPYLCVNDSTQLRTIEANEYVEVRMVFGAESDERFDWTRFDVLVLTADDCKQGGWQDLGFKNQGECVSSVRIPARGK